jgi:hypothetical protein
MSVDDEHEVIDSPAALFRHLSEAHGLDEARDLDPETTPVHPWLRRHADLERAARLAAARRREDAAAPAAAAPNRTAPAEAAPAPPGGRQVAGFRDPLVEALARGLARRGHDERRLRAAIRAYVSPDGRRQGEDGVRAELIGPLLDALAAELDGATVAGGRLEPSGSPPVDQGSGARAPAPGPSQAASPPPPRATPPGRPTAQDDVMALANAVQGRRGGAPARTGGAATGMVAAPGDDDVMAIANAVQRRRRPAGRT